MGRLIADRTVSVALQANVRGFISGVKRAQAESGKLSTDLARHARENEQAWDRTGKALMGIGLAAGAGVGVAIAKYASFEKQMSAVQAATLASADEMEALSDVAIKAGQDTAFSAQEAAMGIEELAKAGISTTDIVGGGLTGALDLAAAGGLDVAQASEIAATAMVQFGLKGDQVATVADALAAGANKAQGSVQDLGLALSYAGVPAAALGLSVEETTGVLALFANAGIVGEKAGTAFRSMLVSLQNPSAKAATLMEDLGIQVFDAQGNFIGMEATAGVLQERLGGLDQQTRGAALATIFGNEALGAATSLYNGGADAVATWADNVSQAGYAADVAATRLDNLAGDLQILKGSLETALIGLGESGSGPLREMTQDLTTLVNIFSGLPEGVQSTVLALGGVTAAVGLAGGAAIVAVPKVLALYGALQQMGPAGVKAAAGLRAMGLAAGPIGIALTAIGVAGGIALDSYIDQKQAVDSYAGSLDQLTGALTRNSREVAKNALESDGVLEAAERLGVSTKDLTDAVMGNAEAQARVNEQVAAAGLAYDASVGDVEGYAAAQGQLRADADLVTGSMHEQSEAITEAQAVIRRKAAADGAAGDAANKAAIEHAELTGQVYNAGEAAEATTGSTEGLTGSIEDVASAAEVAEEEFKQLDAALDQLFASELSVQEATDATEQAIADLAAETVKAREDGIKPLSESVNANTEAGRANRASINDTMRTIAEEAVARAKQGESVAVVTGRVNEAREALIREMVQMGYTREEAEAYTVVLNDVPTLVQTNITTPGMTRAMEDAAELKKILDNMPKNLKISTEVYTSEAKRDLATARRGAQGDAPGSFSGTLIGGKALARVQSSLPGGLRITSTYRSPAHNARVGGSPTSKHMDRNNPAVDIGGPTALLDIYAARLAAMGGWRQLLWRVPGHYDHIHVAHSGGPVESSWPTMPGLRSDERPAILQVGEHVQSKAEVGAAKYGRAANYSGAGGAGAAVRPTVNVTANVTADAPLAAHYARDVAHQATVRLQDAIAANGLAGIATGAY